MYAAGITVREISDRVNHPRSTVHKHLELREQYIPGLRATHEAAFTARRPDWPTHHWRTRLSDLVTFIASNDRPPRLHGTPYETALYRWIREQRRTQRSGTLHPAKQQALSQALPDWGSII